MIDLDELNDEDRFDLEYDMNTYGHKDYQTDFFETREFDQLRSALLMDLPKNALQLKFKFYTKEELLKTGKGIVDRHAYNTDTRVPYADVGELEAKIGATFGDDTLSRAEEVVDFIANEIELLEVTDIPVELKPDRLDSSYTELNRYRSLFDAPDELIRKAPVSFGKICIEGACKETKVSDYVHEMYHDLGYKNKGAIENILHREVLPIFMEKITAWDLDNLGLLLAVENMERFVATKSDVIKLELRKHRESEPLEMLRDETYILSTVVASSLFNTYKNSCREIKAEIDDSINGILRGDHTLEDVLYKYEATPKRGAKVMKKKIKRFSHGWYL